jgi:hypothetical protein
MWLHPLIPNDDELLSSWILRLSRIHILKPHTFCDIAWPKKEIWTRDIDVCADDQIFQVLLENTLATLKEIKATSLQSFEGVICENISSKTQNKWISSLGVYHRTHRRFGQMFCPLCLKEAPYYKKSWRLSIFTDCPRHGTQLLDSCPRCHKPITPKQVNYKNNITQCYYCNNDLGDCSVTNSLPTDHLRVKFFRLVLKHKWIRYQGSEVYSVAYFQLLEKILWLVCNRRTRRHIFTSTVDDVGLPDTRWQLHLLRVNERRAIMRQVWRLLVNYPASVELLILKAKLSWSQIQADQPGWPYFVDQELRPLLKSLSAVDICNCQLK